MKKFLINFLENKNILNPNQFGFHCGLNMFDALRTLSEEIYSALNNKHYLLSIFVDFTKGTIYYYKSCITLELEVLFMTVFMIIYPT